MDWLLLRLTGLLYIYSFYFNVSHLKVREICEMIASGIQPLQNLSVLQKIGNEKKMEWAHFYINNGFIGEPTSNISLNYLSGCCV